MVSDIESHNELKEIAKKLLRNRGYKEDQIFSEYELILPDRDYSYVVDVVAFKDTKDVDKSEFRERARGTAIPDVMIECGDTTYRKIVELEFIGKEVLWLPYGTFPPEFFAVNRLRKAEEVISRLRRIIKQFRERNEELEELLKNRKTTE
jgi:hypothetical protein